MANGKVTTNLSLVEYEDLLLFELDLRKQGITADRSTVLRAAIEFMIESMDHATIERLIVNKEN